MRKLLAVLVAALVVVPLISLAQDRREENDRRRDQGYGNYSNRQQNRLSAEDQSRYDSYYSRWLQARQNNNREETSSMEGRMREVMTRNSISPNTDFAQLASGNARRNTRRSIPSFGGDDSKRFRSYYSRWQGYRQTNNHEQMGSMEGRMRDIMSRHNIPGDASYDEVMNALGGRR